MIGEGSVSFGGEAIKSGVTDGTGDGGAMSVGTE